MTIIIAAQGADGTWLGADGRGLVNGVKVYENERKWNTSADGKWAYGGAGEVTYDAVLGGVGLWPESAEGIEGARCIAKQMRKKLDAVKGFEQARDDGSPFGDYGFSPIVAGPGGIWRLCSDLRSVNPPFESRYLAVGCGGELALGAMSALLNGPGETPMSRRVEISAEDLVRAGLETACRLNAYCGGELFVERLGEAPAPRPVA